jgi:ABC-type Fe3+-siderophore transport system permease subunit
MTDSTQNLVALDIREKIAHIDQMLADHDRKRQEIKYAPWALIVPTIVGALTAGAALFAAGAAFMKLFG